jgi:hypothetical protein
VADLVEQEIRWGQLGIGHVIFQGDRKWEVVAIRAPEQYEYGHSNWLKVRAPRGEEHAIAPKPLNKKVTVLIDPDADPIEPGWAEGAAEVALLVEALGAVEIATQDARTGEVWCPTDYGNDGDHGAAMMLHLQVAHNLDTSGIETAKDRAKAHGRAHNPAEHLFGKGGFTHRHVPEDLSIT